MAVCGQCGEDNPDKAKFCLSCGTALAKPNACPSCGEENPDRAKFCLSCGTGLAAPEEKREIRKMVSIVFTDLVGSTAMGERLDPESLRRVMLIYFDEMRAVVDRHGGVIEKFIGDAVMAVFGIPLVNEDDALRAIRTAVDMRSALGDLNKQLEQDWGVTITVRTGVNTGEVLAGESWDMDTGILGDTVNTAARFEQAAPPGEILIGASTYSLVRNEVEVEAVEPLTLKGKAQPVPVYKVLSLKQTDAIDRHIDSPMVGRENELGLLNNSFERAVGERSCHMFTVMGPAGVGKSRLATELLRNAPDGTRVVRGRCLPYGEGITFWPIVEIVKEAASVTDEDTTEVARAKVQRLFELSEDSELAAKVISQLVGFSEATASREEIFWAVRRLFENLARTTPLVAILDDIHWAETTLLDLIEHMADTAKDAPILLLCMARPDLVEMRPGWGGGKTNAASILLEALTEEAAEALLDNLLGKADLSKSVRARILDASGGNPFFVEELVSMMIDQGLLTKRDGAWVPTEDLDTINVPPTINALLSARLDRLQKEERHVVERASVMGKIFTVRGVTELTPGPAKPQVQPALTSLESKEFVLREMASQAASRELSRRAVDTDSLVDETYTFRHILIRDAAYNGLPKEARAELHESFANWFTDFLGERASEQEEILGYHLEQAFKHRAQLGMMREKHKGLATRASAYLASAGRRAARRGDDHAAVNLLGRAVDLLPDGDATKVKLMPELGVALMDSGDFDEAEQIFQKGIDAAEAIGDKGSGAHARVQKFILLQQTDLETSAEEAIAEAEKAIDVFEELHDEIGLSTAWHLKAYSFTTLARSLDAERALERSIAHGKRANNHLAEAVSRRALIVTMLFGPTSVEDLVRRVEDHLEWARLTGDLVTEARALGALGQARGMLGEADEARALIEREKRILDELGSRLRLAWTAFEASAVELLAGDPDGAEKELIPAYEFLEQMGEKATLSTLAAILAEVRWLQGDAAEADRLTLVSQENSTEDDFLSQMAWRATRAKVLGKAGDLEAAEALCKEAIEISAKTDYLETTGSVFLAYSEVLMGAGRKEESEAMAREALRLFGEKGNIVSADLATELLEQLNA